MAARVSYVLLALSISIIAAYGYSMGAPEEVCQDMFPQHSEDPQIDGFPYIIKPSSYKIKPNETINVTIYSEIGTKFKGFMVQARVSDIPFGSFGGQKGVNLLNCNDGRRNAATHTDANDKESLTLVWTAPPDLPGDIKFTATVVKDGGMYWVKRKSEKVFKVSV